LFCDADDEVEATWAENMWSTLKSGAAFVGGTLIVYRGEQFLFEKGLDNSLWSVPFASGANFGLTAETLARLGGIPEDFSHAGEDANLSWSAQLQGIQLSHSSESRVKYFARETLKGHWNQQFQYGFGHVALFKKFRARGMPRKKFLLFLSSTLKALAALVCWPFLPRNLKFRAVGILALNCGHFVASIRLRTFYV